MARRRGVGFRHADVHRGLVPGRAGRALEAALVAEELHQPARGVDQGDAIGCAVLKSGRVDADEAVGAAGAAQGARERAGGVHLAVGAVVEVQRPAGERGAGVAGDFDAFAGVGAGVVVVDFVDPDTGGGQARAQQQSGHQPADSGLHVRLLPRGR